MLHIAENLTLPLDAVTQTFGILAVRGAGKSNTAAVMAEQMFANHLTENATPFLEARRPLNNDEIFASCMRIVSEPQGRILKVLSEAWPAEIDREKLADRAGASALSSAYTNNLGALRSAGMIEYCADKKVRAADWLFSTNE